MLAAFDLYTAASVQETFGLSVLEALASGLPALYTTCPALDGIETEQARHIAGTAESMRIEITKEVEAGPRARVPDAQVFEQYGIDAVVERVDGLHEQLLASRIRPPARLPRPRRAAQAALATAAGRNRSGQLISSGGGR